MSIYFRVLLCLVSIGTLIFVLIKIRRAQMQIGDAVFWIIFMIGLVVVGVFPGIVIYVSELIGVESAANFVFLSIIFLLLIKVFYLSLQMSKQQYRIQQLTQIIALGEHTRSQGTGDGE